MTDSETPATGPTPLQRAGHLSSVGLLVLGGLLALNYAYVIAVPLVAAIIVFLLLRPVVRALARARVPRPVSAALILAVIVGSLAIGFSLLREPAIAWIERAPQIAFELRYKLDVLLDAMRDASRAGQQIRDFAQLGDEAAPREVVVQGSGVLATLSASIWEVGGGLLLTFVLLYFLMAAGDTFIGRVIEAAPNFRQKQRTISLLGQIEDDVSNYLAMTAVINVVLGIVVGSAFYLCGMPNAALWGVMVAAVNFVPYLGSAVGIAIVAVVSLISFDSVAAAALPPLIYAACTAIEGQFITPSLLGQRLSMNPLFVFLAVVFWSWMWGVAGALLAVPLLVCFRAFCAHIEPLADFATMIGSPRQRNRVAGGNVIPASDTEVTLKEQFMNWDQIEGNWKQIRGRMKERWGKLTDDDLDRIAGRREEAVGRLQEAYGIAREKAEKDLDDWYRTL